MKGKGTGGWEWDGMKRRRTTTPPTSKRMAFGGAIVDDFIFWEVHSLPLCHRYMFTVRCDVQRVAKGGEVVSRVEPRHGGFLSIEAVADIDLPLHDR